MSAKLLVSVLLAAPVASKAACECKTTPESPNQQPADESEGKAYVGADFGYGCKEHDAQSDFCKEATDTAFGQPNDWCLNEWCIVDPETCDQKVRGVSYTLASDDFFSYEACNPEFAGNGWVGYCKNCEAPFTDSFCTCGGLEGCKCIESTMQQVPSDETPGKAYVGEAEAYGYGCMAHDAGHGSCKGAANTADGEANDWCLDAYCIVNPLTCNLKTRAVSYSLNAGDFFSYETCNASFTGNSWVGFCKNCEAPFSDSFCTCGGLEGCKCIESTMQQVPSDETPGKAYVGVAEAYGYGCMAHDAGHGSCEDAANTSDGEANDWCLDAYCIVNASTCNLMTRALSYSLDAGDFFSYETCDDGFRGNSWVGFCRTCEAPYSDNSFCTGECEKPSPTAPPGSCRNPVRISREMAMMHKAKRCE